MLTASDLMTPCPVTVRADDPLSVAESLMAAGLTPIRHLPVLRGGQLVGILSDRDLARARATGAELRHVHVESVMTPSPVIVRPHTPLRRAISRMVRRRVGALPVVDADGAAMGILSVIDVAACFGNVLARMDALHAGRRQGLSTEDAHLVRELASMFLATLPDRIPLLPSRPRRRGSFGTSARP